MRGAPMQSDSSILQMRHENLGTKVNASYQKETAPVGLRLRQQ
jgi:hypothetical protein